MYNRFLNKIVKLVYKDGKREGRDYIRYVKGKVVTIDKSLTLERQNNGRLFAVSIPEIVYVKELKS